MITNGRLSFMSEQYSNVYIQSIFFLNLSIDDIYIFHILTLVNVAAIARNNYLFCTAISFPLHIKAEVELPDHKAVLLKFF